MDSKSNEQTSELAKIDVEQAALHARRVALAEKRAQLNARLYTLRGVAGIDAEVERANILTMLRSPTEDASIAHDEKALFARRDGVMRLANEAKKREVMLLQKLANAEARQRDQLSQLENVRDLIANTRAAVDAAIQQRRSLIGGN